MGSTTLNGNKRVISADVTVMLYQQGDYIVAYCPALELSSYAKTEPEAKSAFNESLEIFLEYCIEHDTLEQNLVACGWKLRNGYHQPDEVVVPLELLKAQQLHSFDKKLFFPIG